MQQSFASSRIKLLRKRKRTKLLIIISSILVLVIASLQIVLAYTIKKFEDHYGLLINYGKVNPQIKTMFQSFWIFLIVLASITIIISLILLISCFMRRCFTEFHKQLCIVFNIVLTFTLACSSAIFAYQAYVIEPTIDSLISDVSNGGTTSQRESTTSTINEQVAIYNNQKTDLKTYKQWAQAVAIISFILQFVLLLIVLIKSLHNQYLYSRGEQSDLTVTTHPQMSEQHKSAPIQQVSRDQKSKSLVGGASNSIANGPQLASSNQNDQSRPNTVSQKSKGSKSSASKRDRFVNGKNKQ